MNGNVGSIEISVRPELRLFRQNLRSELEKIEKSTEFTFQNFSVSKNELKKTAKEIAHDIEKDTKINLHDFGISETKVKETKKTLEKKLSGVEANVDANVDTAVARLKLAWLTRPRKVHIGTVFEDTGKTAQALAAISGIRAGDKTVLWLRNIAMNLDSIAVKSGLVVNALGAMSGAIGGALGGIINFGGGLGKAGKAAMILPSALSAAGVSIGAVAMAAVDGAKRLKDFKQGFIGIQDATSAAFWGKAEQNIRGFLNKAIEPLKAGFEEVGAASGVMVGRIADAMSRSVDDGKLEHLFDTTRAALDRASVGAGKFADAIIELGTQGAAYLPRFGSWFTELGVKFDKFVRTASTNGSLNRWIEQGIQGLKDMGSLVQQTARAWNGLYKAISPNSEGIGGMADKMGRFADMTQKAAFKSGLSTIFEGIRDGSETSIKGIENIGRALGNNSRLVADFFSSVGRNVKTLADGVAYLINSSPVQAGFVKFQAGITGFINSIVGAFRGMEGGLGSALAAIGKVAENTGQVLGGTLTALTPVIEMVGKLIQALPSWVQGGAAAFLLFNKAGDSVKTTMGAVMGSVASLGGGISTLTKTMLLAKQSGFTNMQTVLIGVGKAGNIAAGGIRKAGLALKTFAVANAPVLALTALATAVGFVTSKIREGSEKQEEFRATLDVTTGAVTAETYALADNLIAKNNWIEAAAEIGVSAEDLRAALAGDIDVLRKIKPAIDDNAAGWFGLTASMNSLILGDISNQLEAVEEASKEAAQGSKDLAAAQGVTSEETSKLKSAFDGQIKSVEGALDAMRRYKGDTLTLSEAQVAQAEALEAMNDALNMSGAILNDAGTGFNHMTESGRAAIKNVDGVRQAMWDLGEATKKANPNTDEWVTAMRDYRAEWVKMTAAALGGGKAATKQAEKLADAYGIIPGEAEAAMKASADAVTMRFNDMLAVIDGKTITINGNTVPADAKLSEFIKKVNTRKGTVSINGNDFPANMTFKQLVNKIAATPAEFGLNADTAKAMQEIGKVDEKATEAKTKNIDANIDKALKNVCSIDTKATTPKTKPVNTDTRKAQTNIATIDTLINAAKIKPINADTTKARGQIFYVDALAGAGKVKPVTADTRNAHALISSVDAKAAKRVYKPISANSRMLDSYVAAITSKPLGRSYIEVGIKKVGEWFGNLFGAKNANGNIFDTVSPNRTTVKRFANGGENHVAQIAPAGAWRLWAEPETGGEAYIPFAKTKRARSTAILRAVADRFGYGLVEYGAGGGVAGAPTGENRVYNVSCNIDARDLRDIRELSQFVDLLNLKMKMGV